MEGSKDETAPTLAQGSHITDPSKISTRCFPECALSAATLPDRRGRLPKAGGCSESGGVDDREKIKTDKCYVIEPATLSDNSEDDDDFAYGTDLENELRAALFSASGHCAEPSSDSDLKHRFPTSQVEAEQVNELDDYDQLVRDATRLEKEQAVQPLAIVAPRTGELKPLKCYYSHAQGEAEQTRYVSTELLARADAGDFISKGVPRVTQRHETQEDFIRSFLVAEKMHQTLRSFQIEWYELRLKKARMNSDIVANSEAVEIPSALLVNQQLKGQIAFLEDEAVKQRETASKALCWFDQFKKERDFHRMHHRRLKHEKDKYIQELKHLNRALEEMSTEREGLQQKIEAGIRECTLVKMERDKLAAQVTLLGQQSNRASSGSVAAKPAADRVDPNSNPAVSTKPSLQKVETPKKTIQVCDSRSVTVQQGGLRDAPWRTNRRIYPRLKGAQCEGEVKADGAPAEPYAGAEDKRCVKTTWATRADRVNCSNVLEAHDAAVVSLTMHSKIDLMATTSDDGTWKIWQMPGGHLVMAGSGHEDWVSSAAFHPTAPVLVTASGDGTAKLWSISEELCTHTFTDHTKPLWDCCFHDTGDFFATCSMDHSIRCFDANNLRCRQILRGHTDSVNAIYFQPYTNCIASASSDKLVNLWDVRTGTLVRKFAGHRRSCNDVSFNHQGTAIISCDSEGAVHIWDLRKMSHLLERNSGPAAANSCVPDINGDIIAVSSSDSTVKLLSIKQESPLNNLQGHTDYVLDVHFSKDYTYFCSAGADGKWMRVKLCSRSMSAYPPVKVHDTATPSGALLAAHTFFIGQINPCNARHVSAPRASQGGSCPFGECNSFTININVGPFECHYTLAHIQ